MFHQVQSWRAIRAMCTDSSLTEGHVYNHASNYLAVDYQLIVYGNIASQIHGLTIDYEYIYTNSQQSERDLNASHPRESSLFYEGST